MMCKDGVHSIDAANMGGIAKLVNHAFWDVDENCEMHEPEKGKLFLKSKRVIRRNDPLR